MKPTEERHSGDDYAPPSSIDIAGKTVKEGDLVRLHPTACADAFDMLLEGKVARIVKIEQDLENRIYLVVTVNDDPGQVQWDERILPGHRFFFFPEEVIPLSDSVKDIEEREQKR